jgi:predicted RNA-binding Zn-ribbon protein involved in translation (DUF1610 family)
MVEVGTIERTAIALGELRADLADHAVAAGVKLVHCQSCGAAMPATRRRGRRYCPGCGAGQLTRHEREVSAKSGPGWEKLARGQYAYWRAEVERLGLLAPDDPARS